MASNLFQKFIPDTVSSCTAAPITKYWTRDRCKVLNRLLFVRIAKLLFGSPIAVFFTSFVVAVILSLLLLGDSLSLSAKSKKVFDKNGNEHEYKVIGMSTKDAIITFFVLFTILLVMGLLFGAIIYFNAFKLPQDLDVSPTMRATVAGDLLEIGDDDDEY